MPMRLFILKEFLKNFIKPIDKPRGVEYNDIVNGTERPI